MSVNLSPAVRPCRSALYLPASNARALDKARSLPCDAVILDLEDAVAPELKQQARDLAVAAARQGGFGHRALIVRVNALATDWGAADLAAVRDAGFDAVLAPKIASRDDVSAYDRALAAAPAGTRLWCMIESARSVLHLEAIAAMATSTRLSTFVMGTNDLARELRATLDTSRSAVLPFLSQTVAAARAYGLGILDGVFNDLEDVTALDSQCRQALMLGFDGKTLIHPRQIEVCNRVFSPSADALDWARKVRGAFALPGNAAKGALRLDGAMIERLHLEQAERLLALDAAIRQQDQS
jgi:citrate lyase subunit beta / citryl-CoA lyase